MRVTPHQAFTLVEVMIVVAIIGLLAAIAIPNFIRVRETTQANSCIHNLRLIDAAKQQWALEFRELGSAQPVFSDLEPYLSRASNARVPVCPSGSRTNSFEASYDIREVTNSPTCKIVPATHVLGF